MLFIPGQSLNFLPKSTRRFYGKTVYPRTAPYVCPISGINRRILHIKVF